MWLQWFDDCGDEVRAACNGMLEHLRSAGAEIVQVVIPELELLRVAHACTIGCEAYNGFGYGSVILSINLEFNVLGIL